MIFIKNGKIYTMSGQIIENGSILIENSKVKEVGQNLATPPEAKVIDAEGKFVLPGFIDAHCHIGMWEEAVGFEGSDGFGVAEPPFRYISSRLHAYVEPPCYRGKQGLRREQQKSKNTFPIFRR